MTSCQQLLNHPKIPVLFVKLLLKRPFFFSIFARTRTVNDQNDCWCNFCFVRATNPSGLLPLTKSSKTTKLLCLSALLSLSYLFEFYTCNWFFWPQSLESSDFPDIIPQLRPLMHTICLVYSNSTFYNSPARIIVLMTETCNLLIGIGRKYLDPGSIFQVKYFLLQ